MNKELDASAVGQGRTLFTTRELTIVGMLAGITVLLGVTGYGFIDTSRTFSHTLPVHTVPFRDTGRQYEHAFELCYGNYTIP